MLRFCDPTSDDEFTIVNRAPKQKAITKPRSAKRKVVTENALSDVEKQIEIKPLWVDEADNNHPITQSAHKALDLFAIRQKKTPRLGSGDEIGSPDAVIKHKCHILYKDSEELPGTKEILIRRLHDANRERRSISKLVSTEFNTHFQILLTGSSDSTLALFKVEGTENPLLRDRVFERFPISCAKFNSSGDRVILTGDDPQFRLYDLETGHETRASRFIGVPKTEKLVKCEVSSDHPNTVALTSNSNFVYLADLRSLEKIAILRANSTVKSMCFGHNGSYLNTFADNSMVFVFDMRTQNHRVVHKWQNQACTGSSSISSSPDSQWIACGSESGYVNIYPWDRTLTSQSPEPEKTIQNLVTDANLLSFHPSSEILCLGSSQSDEAVRLYHVNARQLFDNFPVRVGRLGRPTSIGFSPGGAYLCIGQSNGRAALYKISHYPNY